MAAAVALAGQQAASWREHTRRLLALEALTWLLFQHMHLLWTELPWRLLLALIGLGGLLVYRSLYRRTTSVQIIDLVPVLFSVVAFVVRPKIGPFVFFHQNGQGPHWVSNALSVANSNELYGPSAFMYGPGYRELFGWVTPLESPSPEIGIGIFQSFLASFTCVAGYSIARSVGAKKWFALLISLTLLLDPLALRLTNSESHFGAQIALLYMASWALSVGTVGKSFRSIPYWVSIVVAGLFIAQAARIHPAAWVPSATIPFIVILQRGSLIRRATNGAICALSMGLIVLLFAGQEISEVLGGQLGESWIHVASNQHLSSRLFEEKRYIFLAVFLLGLTFYAFKTKHTRLGVMALVFVLTIAVRRWPLFVGIAKEQPWIEAAHLRLFGPLLVALFANLSAIVWSYCPLRFRKKQHLIYWGAIPALSITAFAVTPTLTMLPTDAQEQLFAMSWRTKVPAGSIVYYLERFEPHERVLSLPLYPSKRNEMPVPVAIHSFVSIPVLEPGAFYYRSHLCSLPKGQHACQQLESAAQLELVDQKTLSALGSAPWFEIPAPNVTVALFKVLAISNPLQALGQGL